MPMKVRPWKAPEKAMTAWRPVAARAILTAFSTASAPVVTKIAFFSPLIGAIAVRRSASRT